MANKTTNYLIGFLSGVVTGGSLGLLFYLNRNKKNCSTTISKDETTESVELKEKKKYSFFHNFIVKNILSIISSVTEKESEKKEFKK